MPEYSAFYDVSGSQGEKAEPLVVACVLSSVDRWKRFDHEWNAALADYGLRELHMRTIRNNWDGDTARYDKFMDRLIRIMRRNISHVFTHRLTPSDFEYANRYYELAKGYIRSSYPFLVLACTSHIENVVKATLRTWTNPYHIVAAGDAGQGIVQQLVQQAPEHIKILGKEAMGSGILPPPLQAADLVAYEVRHDIKSEERNKYAPTRRALVAMDQKFPNFEMKRWETKGIFAFCRAFPERFPRRGTPLPEES